jgi:outer membrane lipoprotein-sorting protein
MKKTKTYLFIALCFVTQAIIAQSFGVPKDETALRKKIIEASQKINSIQCNFEQEKVSSMLAEKAISKGEFLFKKDNKVKLDYREPFSYLIVMNNGKLLIKDEDKTRQVNLSRSRSFQQLNRIIVDCINGNMLRSTDFTVKLFENNTLAKLELTPINKTVKSFLSGIVVILEKSDFSALRIEMNEASGDRTILRFSAKKLNGEIANEQFVLQQDSTKN